MLNAESQALQIKMMELESGSIIRDYGVQNLLGGRLLFLVWPLINNGMTKLLTRLNYLSKN